jgi:hypothetical protein
MRAKQNSLDGGMRPAGHALITPGIDPASFTEAFQGSTRRVFFPRNCVFQN